MTFYGEEHGLVGSRYYVEHPVVPLEKTVADINLEQVGRTDDSDGPARLGRDGHRLRLLRRRGAAPPRGPGGGRGRA